VFFWLILGAWVIDLRTWVREKLVAHPAGWIAPFVCAAAVTVLAAVPTAVEHGPELLAEGYEVLLVLVLTVVAALFEAVYVGLWRGTMPWVGAGQALVRALMWSLGMGALGLSIFVPVTYWLYRAGAFHVRSGVHDPAKAATQLQTSWDFAKAYLWQLCDAVPALNIAGTMQWREPIKHGSGLGLLLLVFRCLVLIPTVTALGGIWRSWVRRASHLSDDANAP
jgi:hypothetical protein